MIRMLNMDRARHRSYGQQIRYWNEDSNRFVVTTSSYWKCIQYAVFTIEPWYAILPLTREKWERPRRLQGGTEQLGCPLVLVERPPPNTFFKVLIHLITSVRSLLSHMLADSKALKSCA